MGWDGMGWDGRLSCDDMTYIHMTDESKVGPFVFQYGPGNIATNLQ